MPFQKLMICERMPVTCLEGFVLVVQQFLGRGQYWPSAPNCSAALGLLLGAERLADAEPGEAHPDGGEVGPQALAAAMNCVVLVTSDAGDVRRCWMDQVSWSWDFLV